MRKKVYAILLLLSISLTMACGGKRAPQLKTDTLSKADATKDTLGIDTNKSAGKDSIGIKKDTGKAGK